MKLICTWLAAIALLTAIAVSCCAEGVPAISYTDSPVCTWDGGPGSLGFWFQTNAPITVTALGYYDYEHDGLAIAHKVGVFDSAGNLMTWISVESGAAAPLIGNYRYASISPLNLNAGELYMLAATFSGVADPYSYGQLPQLEELVIDPSITLTNDSARYRYYVGDDLLIPVSSFGYAIYGGPNMLITTEVPECSSLLLTLMGGLGIIGHSIRRRK